MVAKLAKPIRAPALTTRGSVEVTTDPAKRNALIKEAFTIHKNDVGHIPLHQAGLAWGARKGVSMVLRSDDSLELKWVRVEN